MSSLVTTAPSAPSAPPPIPTAQLSFQPAGFWIRALAHLIDTTLISVVLFPLLIVVLWDDIMAQATSGIAVQLPLSLHIILNLPPIIIVVLMWRWRSATPGKMLCKLKITDSNSFEKPAWKQCFVRFFGYIPPMIPITVLSWPQIVPGAGIPLLPLLLTLPLLVGFLSIGWDPRKQGWHDKLAKTLVIRTKV